MRFDDQKIEFGVVTLLESTPGLSLWSLKPSVCLIIFSLKTR